MKIRIITIAFLLIGNLCFSQTLDSETQTRITVIFKKALKDYEEKNYDLTLAKLDQIKEMLKGREIPNTLNLRIKALIGLNRFTDAKTNLGKLYGMNPKGDIIEDIISYEDKITNGIKAEANRKEEQRLADLRRKEQQRLAELRNIEKVKEEEQKRLQAIESRKNYFLSEYEKVYGSQTDGYFFLKEGKELYLADNNMNKVKSLNGYSFEKLTNRSDHTRFYYRIYKGTNRFGIIDECHIIDIRTGSYILKNKNKFFIEIDKYNEGIVEVSDWFPYGQSMDYYLNNKDIKTHRLSAYFDMRNGKFITNFEFSSGSTEFSDGMAAVQKVFKSGGRSKYRTGYINTNGELVIDYQYAHAEPFKNGVAKVRKPKGNVHYIDKRGKRVK